MAHHPPALREAEGVTCHLPSGVGVEGAEVATEERVLAEEAQAEVGVEEAEIVHQCKIVSLECSCKYNISKS